MEKCWGNLVSQPGEERALGRPDWKLLVYKGSLYETQRQAFSKACCDRAKGNGFKLKGGRFRLDMKKFFAMRLVKHWKRLFREAVDWKLCHWKCSRPGCKGLWATWSSARCSCPWQGGGTPRLDGPWRSLPIQNILWFYWKLGNKQKEIIGKEWFWFTSKWHFVFLFYFSSIIIYKFTLLYCFHHQLLQPCICWFDSHLKLFLSHLFLENFHPSLLSHLPNLRDFVFPQSPLQNWWSPLMLTSHGSKSLVHHPGIAEVQLIAVLVTHLCAVAFYLDQKEYGGASFFYSRETFHSLNFADPI